MLTPEQLAKVYQCPLARAKLWVKPINDAMARFDINTPLRAAHFLAQVGHESGRLRYVRELASGRAYNGRVDLGNMRPEALATAKVHGSTAGEWWKGHGLIQITGYDNHLACGVALGLNLIEQPTLLEQPENAALSAAWFWSTKNLNALADADDVMRITRRINGGTNGINDRLSILATAKEVLSCG